MFVVVYLLHIQRNNSTERLIGDSRMGNYSSSAITNTITNNDSELAERPLKRLKVSSSFVEGSDLETTSIVLPPGKY